MSAILLALVALGCNGDNSFTQLYPSIVVTPNPIEFYDAERNRSGIVVGETYTLTVEISNTERTPLDLSSIYMGGGSPAFTVTEPEVMTVDEDEAVTFTIEFAPTEYDLYDEVLVIESNDQANDGVTEIPVFAEGVEAPVPCIAVDPTSLDFGDVAAGGYVIDTIQITNCGELDLTIDGVRQSGSGAFQRASSDPVGAILSPGGQDKVTVNLAYNPLTEDGDSGVYTVLSNDPETPELDVALIGNGGGDGAYPEAVIDCPEAVEPQDVLTLDGSASFDPSGLEITDYLWTLETRPDGSQASLTDDDDDSTGVTLDAAGDYVVTLQVTNEYGSISAPAECRMDAIPPAFIHIELTWNTNDTDLDLHVANGKGETQGDTFFDRTVDVNYCNEEGEWGDSSTDLDNGILEVDDVLGYGPENFVIYEPADGEYLARVHYYDTDGSEDTTATVRFYLRGVEKAHFERKLNRNDVWDVGYVRWPEELVVGLGDEEDGNDLYTAPYRECYTPE